jgi:hypothetical protein
MSLPLIRGQDSMKSTPQAPQGRSSYRLMRPTSRPPLRMTALIPP